jgi:hypothetical protein
MRVGRLLLIVGIITMSSMFYIYQQCLVAFRPLQKRVERLASLDYDYEGKLNANLGRNSILAENMINGEFSESNNQLHVAKK